MNGGLTDPPEVTPRTHACWRCGKQVALGLSPCPFCAAHQPGQQEAAGRVASAEAGDATALLRTLAAFGIMLAISWISGFAAGSRGLPRRGGTDLDPRDALTATMILEAVTTALSLAAVLWIPVRFRPAKKPLAQRAAVWAAFGPVLLGVLAANLLYHRLLRALTDLPLAEDAMWADPDLLPWWFLVVCVQPAVVEELFFRYLALGVLRSSVGVHAAVLVSSAMFAMAHIGVPLSLPVLFVLGIALGYARVASGGMALPMILHFLHNAAVIGVEWLHLQA